ncbi:MAG TPA: ABC transporter ATP-binding protein [Firmicutes bacterium]|nr:ABC transporter ATP-binding protein [Bacillota bacterium]
MPGGNSLLQLVNLTKVFGGLVALSDVSLDICEGELAGLIGPNGAGKTTVFNIITGLLRPTTGYVRFNGSIISGRRPDIIARLGISRTFQNTRLLKRLTVLDNLMIAYNMKCNYSILHALAGLPRFRKVERQVTEEAMEYLGLFGLDALAGMPAGSLPYGYQRRLEIARALVPRPRLLLLDEPAAGMNPSETAELLELIHKVKSDFNLTVLLVEHDMKFVMSICKVIHVLNKGELIASGPPETIKNNPKVIEAYLGTRLTSVRRAT